MHEHSSVDLENNTKLTEQNLEINQPPAFLICRQCAWWHETEHGNVNSICEGKSWPHCGYVNGKRDEKKCLTRKVVLSVCGNIQQEFFIRGNGVWDSPFRPLLLGVASVAGTSVDMPTVGYHGVLILGIWICVRRLWNLVMITSTLELGYGYVDFGIRISDSWNGSSDMRIQPIGLWGYGNFFFLFLFFSGYEHFSTLGFLIEQCSCYTVD